MFIINVWLTVKDRADIPKIRELLAEQARRSRPEPGCQRFEVYHSTNDDTKFLLCEYWDTKDAWEVHKTAAAFVEVYQPKVLPLVNREPHFCEQVA
jgi:quinol monooxygenase YgiN